MIIVIHELVFICLTQCIWNLPLVIEQELWEYEKIYPWVTECNNDGTYNLEKM